MTNIILFDVCLALRGATTLKSRPKKESIQWSNSLIIPFEQDGIFTPTSSTSEDIIIDENDAEFCNNRALLAKGTELLIHVPKGNNSKIIFHFYI